MFRFNEPFAIISKSDAKGLLDLFESSPDMEEFCDRTVRLGLFNLIKEIRELAKDE